MTVQIIPNVTTVSPLTWAGTKFPYHENAADITISGATTWEDAEGFKRVGILTINANQVLTIRKSPFFIFADAIVFGNTSSQISGDGQDGLAAGSQNDAYAIGALANVDSARAQGGCGGIMLFVFCNTISGAAGKITANGGDGLVNTTLPTTTDVVRAGQGSLSSSIWSDALTTGENNVGFSTILGSSGGNLATRIGKGGGSGGGSGTDAGGGSGIGGGGGILGTGAPALPPQTALTTSPGVLLNLAAFGCLGGGGGAAGVFRAATQNENIAGGGGGGAVMVYCKNLEVTPTLEAFGGSVSEHLGTGHAQAGANGITILTDIL